MGKLIAIHSFRGGTGKSNISGNLAALLACKGYRVGVIDTDIQSPGVHALFSFSSETVKNTLNDYLLKKCSIEEAAYDVTGSIQTSDQPVSGCLYLIPSSMKTGEITRILQDGYDVGRLNIGFQQLMQKLSLDYLLVDTHPGVNEETLLAAAISDALLLILRPDRQDHQGTAIMLELAKQLEVPKIFLVINKAVNQKDFAAMTQRVESSFGHPVVAVIPLSDEIAALGSTGLFCLRAPNHPMAHALEKVLKELQ